VVWMGWMMKKKYKPVYYDIFEHYYNKYNGDIREKRPHLLIGDPLAEDYGPFEKGTTLNKEIADMLVKMGYDTVKIAIRPAHAINMAIVKTAKIFLYHYWCVGRFLDGLDITSPWIHKYRGHEEIVPPMIDDPERKVWPRWWEIRRKLEEIVGRPLREWIPEGVYYP